MHLLSKFIILCILITSLIRPILVDASCDLQKPNITPRLIRLLNRSIIYLQFTPTKRIQSYFKSVKKSSNSYEESIQQTHALTLAVTELHRLRQINFELYNEFQNIFDFHNKKLIALKANHTNCSNEYTQLLDITAKNLEIADELLIDRLPDFQTP